MVLKRYFILDRSGSMSIILDQTIKGFNSFVESQINENGTMSLYLFDYEFLPVYEDLHINEVTPLNRQTYVPRGSTALLDAIGETIKRVKEEPGDEIVIVILTDGIENSSCQYNSNDIKILIENSKWTFMYLGANQDSILEAGILGIPSTQTLDFCGDSVGSVLQCVSATMSARSQGTPATLRTPTHL